MADLSYHYKNEKDDDDDGKNLDLDPEPTTSTPQDKTNSVISFSQKYKLHRPPNLVINDDVNNNNNNTLKRDSSSSSSSLIIGKENNNSNNIDDIVNLLQCSPVRSPFPSNESLNDDFLLNKYNHDIWELNNDYSLSLMLENYESGIIRNNNNENLTICQMNILCLLKHFGLSHLAFIFVEQEIDIELFLTLGDKDLQEIGIQKKTDRKIILSVIAECNKRFK